MTGPTATESGQTFKDAFGGSLKRPTNPLKIGIFLALGAFGTVFAIYVIFVFVPESGFPAVRQWWARLGTLPWWDEYQASFQILMGTFATFLITVFPVTMLGEAIVDIRNEMPLRRIGQELVVIRELTEQGVGYRERDTTVYVPWAQIQELRSMDLPALEGKLFFVVELKSPIHERGRLVFWDGQDYWTSIAGRLRERLAAYRAARSRGDKIGVGLDDKLS